MNDPAVSHPSSVSNVLELEGVSKFFPGVMANDKIDLTLQQGEIHTLLGENGAGKSTLMNIIAGLYPPDEGVLRVHGKRVHFRNPAQAIRAGIGMVHQHFMLVQNHTVTENIILGTPQRFGLNLKKINREIESLGETYGLAVDPRARIQDLSVGEQQRVEILKVLYRGATILILDEPTAVLAPQESEALYQIIHNLVGNGHSIVFISHKMKEVMALSHRITVLSRGKVLASKARAETDAQELARIMMGDEVRAPVTVAAASNSESAQPVIQLSGISARDDRGAMALKHVNLEVRAGQIVGLAGVSGNGQVQLAEVLTGMRPYVEGAYRFCGEVLDHPNVSELIRRGVGYIPEDRKKYGIAPNLSIAHNFLLRDHDHPGFYSHGLLNNSGIQAYGRRKMAEFDIRAAHEKSLMITLSGGNMQKCILARESSRSLVFLLASQPVRGLDIHAAAFIQHTLLQAKSQGLAMLLISEDLDELFFMCDLIVVMCGGEVVGALPKAEATIEQVGLMMTGEV
jgi:simple sugar transport system ATP-binding protein